MQAAAIWLCRLELDACRKRSKPTESSVCSSESVTIRGHSRLDEPASEIQLVHLGVYHLWFHICLLSSYSCPPGNLPVSGRCRNAGVTSVQRQALGKALNWSKTHCPQQSFAFRSLLSIYPPLRRKSASDRSLFWKQHKRPHGAFRFDGLYYSPFPCQCQTNGSS